jgi:hypothetical protein
MYIKNNATLARFRTKGRCECCGAYCRRREPHHLFTRGAGQLDIPINLVALGSSRLHLCECHARAQEIGRDAFLEIVAKREKVSAAWIVEEIYRLRRLPQPREREAEGPVVKRTKKKTAWQLKAGDLRRARQRRLYRWAKERRKKRAKE